MFATLALATISIALGAAQYRYSMSGDIPTYIKRALRQKDQYKATPRERKRTISNLTLTEVYEKIKDITAALNRHAKINGYKVDYKFRVIEKGK